MAMDLAAAESREFVIPPQGLPSALELLIKQADIELLYDGDAVEGKTTAGVAGRYTVSDALAKLLQGTGLHFLFTTPTTAAIQASPAPRPARPSPAQDRAPDEFSPLIVSATRSDTPTAETPAAANVITAENLQLRHVDTVDQALNLTPGGYFRRGKGLMDTGSNISLRGFPTARRTAILLNGIPLNDTYTGDANFSAVNLDDVAQIEIVRGPFSSLYGGNAMGGVVNIVTKEPSGTDAHLSLGYGDAFAQDTAPEGAFGASFTGNLQLTDMAGLRASVNRRMTDGYPTNFISRTAPLPAGITGAEATTDSLGNPRFIIGHSGTNGYQDENYTFAGNIRLSETDRLDANIARSQSRYDYRDPRSLLRDANGEERFLSTTGDLTQTSPTANYLSGPGGTDQDQYTASYTGMRGNVSSKLSLGYIDQYDGWFITPAATATIGGGPGTLSRTVTTHRILDWQVEMPLGSRHILTAGLFYRRGDASNTEHGLADWTDRDSGTARTYTAEGQESIHAVFAQDRYDITDRITTYLGIRQDWWESSHGLADSVGVSGFPIHYPDRSDHRISPKAALTYQYTPATRYRLAAGRSFRAPAVFELYRTWLSASSGTTFQSNPTLDPETATSWEAGLDHESAHDLHLSATFFANRMNDFIYRTTVSSTPALQRFENAAEASSQGIELSLTGRVNSVNWQAGYTYTDAVIERNPRLPTSEGKRIAQIPRNVANLGADWRRDKLSLGATVRYVDSRFNRDDNADDVHGVPGAYDGYVLVDMKFGYRLTEHLGASLSIDNLTGDEWYDFYRSPGRSWFAQLTLDI